MFTFETLMFIILCITVVASSSKNKDFSILAKDQSDCFRGIFAFFIVLNHISKEHDILDNLYSYLSLAVVSSFFFISGFGLMKGFMYKGEYRKSFLKKRFTRLVLPYMITTLIYWVYYYLINERISLFNVIVKIFKFQPIVTYSWFILDLIIQYFIFYVLMWLSKNKKMFVNIVICLTVVSLILFTTNNKIHFYLNPYFGLGILFARYKKEVSSFLKMHTVKLATGSILITIIYLFNVRRLVSLNVLMNILFIILMLLYSERYMIKNHYLSHLGKISLELYMYHGLAKMIIRRFLHINMYVDNAIIML